MQSLLHNKLSTLQSKKTSPRKRAAVDTDNDRVNKDGKEVQHYQPPHKRREVQQQLSIKEMLIEKVNSDGNSAKEVKKEPTKANEELASAKVDFSLLDIDFGSDFANRSWVDIIDEENRRESGLYDEECDEKEEANMSQIEGKVEMVSTLNDENLCVEINEVLPKASISAKSTPGRGNKNTPNPKEEWPEPNKGWCWDNATLERRERELQKMKEKPTYLRYLSQIPKTARKKNVHPRTPNKYIKWTRRSWDQQVKIWKLAIYEWAGETPTSSVNASYCSSECSDDETRSLASSAGPSTPKRIKLEKKNEAELQKSEEARVKLFKDVSIALANPETMASMLGHFDLDTMRGEPTLMTTEESTLKAAPTAQAMTTDSKEPPPVVRVMSYASVVMKTGGSAPKGPTDFSHMMSVKSEPTQEENKTAKAVIGTKRGRLTKKNIPRPALRL